MDTIRLDKFIELAVMQEEYIYEGNSNKVNSLHKKIESILMKIVCDNNEVALYKTISSEHESVQLWSAVTLLKCRDDIGIKKLQEMTEYESIYGLKAQTIIDMWQKGMIKPIK